MKRIYALVVMLIVLAVFTTRSQASQSNPFTALPVIRAAAGNHPPVILRVVDREEIRNGSVYLHKDIYFTDPGGDAVKVVNKLRLSRFEREVDINRST